MARGASVKTQHGSYRVKAILDEGLVVNVYGEAAHC
jgi:hypothetical protein